MLTVAIIFHHCVSLIGKTKEILIFFSSQQQLAVKINFNFNFRTEKYHKEM
jgi:hypothetical protein